MKSTSIARPKIPFGLGSEHGSAGAAQPVGGIAPAVAGIGDAHRGQGIEGPGREAPVEEAVARRPLDCLGRSGFGAVGRCLVVVRPLDDAPVHQPTRDARAEEHREPGKVAELLVFNALAQHQPAVAAARDVADESERADPGPQVGGAQVRREPAVEVVDHEPAGFWRDGQGDGDEQEKRYGGQEDRPVHLLHRALRIQLTSRGSTCIHPLQAGQRARTLEEAFQGRFYTCRVGILHISQR